MNVRIVTGPRACHVLWDGDISSDYCIPWVGATIKIVGVAGMWKVTALHLELESMGSHTRVVTVIQQAEVLSEGTNAAE